MEVDRRKEEEHANAEHHSVGEEGVLRSYALPKLRDLFLCLEGS